MPRGRILSGLRSLASSLRPQTATENALTVVSPDIFNAATQQNEAAIRQISQQVGVAMPTNAEELQTLLSQVTTPSRRGFLRGVGAAGAHLGGASPLRLLNDVNLDTRLHLNSSELMGYLNSNLDASLPGLEATVAGHDAPATVRTALTGYDHMLGRTGLSDPEDIGKMLREIDLADTEKHREMFGELTGYVGQFDPVDSFHTFSTPESLPGPATPMREFIDTNQLLNEMEGRYGVPGLSPEEGEDVLTPFSRLLEGVYDDQTMHNPMGGSIIEQRQLADRSVIEEAREFGYEVYDISDPNNLRSSDYPKLQVRGDQVVARGTGMGAETWDPVPITPQAYMDQLQQQLDSETLSPASRVDMQRAMDDAVAAIIPQRAVNEPELLEPPLPQRAPPELEDPLALPPPIEPPVPDAQRLLPPLGQGVDRPIPPGLTEVGGVQARLPNWMQEPDAPINQFTPEPPETRPQVIGMRIDGELPLTKENIDETILSIHEDESGMHDAPKIGQTVGELLDIFKADDDLWMSIGSTDADQQLIFEDLMTEHGLSWETPGNPIVPPRHAALNQAGQPQDTTIEIDDFVSFTDTNLVEPPTQGGMPEGDRIDFHQPVTAHNIERTLQATQTPGLHTEAEVAHAASEFLDIFKADRDMFEGMSEEIQDYFENLMYEHGFSWDTPGNPPIILPRGTSVFMGRDESGRITKRSIQGDIDRLYNELMGDDNMTDSEVRQGLREMVDYLADDANRLDMFLGIPLTTRNSMKEMMDEYGIDWPNADADRELDIELGFNDPEDD